VKDKPTGHTIVRDVVPTLSAAERIFRYRFVSGRMHVDECAKDRQQMRGFIALLLYRFTGVRLSVICPCVCIQPIKDAACLCEIGMAALEQGTLKGT
jgi:hypothetical protein